MHRIAIIIILFSVSLASKGECEGRNDIYYVARPFHMAGLERINQSLIYNSRKDYLNKIFGMHNWDSINNNIFIKAPDRPENKATITISTEILKPLSRKGTVYLFAEYRHNSDFQYERLSKINFKRNITSYTSRYYIPVTALIFAVIHDSETNMFFISKNKKVNISGYCPGSISVATQIEADKNNRKICNKIPITEKSKHYACLALK